jgi:hypothetical protein
VQSSNEVLLGSPRAELDFVSFHEELLMNQMGFPRAARVSFVFFIFFAFILSVSVETSAKGKRSKGKAERSSKSKSTRARASSRPSRAVAWRSRVRVASAGEFSFHGEKRALSEHELRASKPLISPSYSGDLAAN